MYTITYTGGVWGAGIPSPNGREYVEGVSPSQKIFLIFEIKMVTFGALWVLFLQFGCLLNKDGL